MGELVSKFYINLVWIAERFFCESLHGKDFLLGGLIIASQPRTWANQTLGMTKLTIDRSTSLRGFSS